MTVIHDEPDDLGLRSVTAFTSTLPMRFRGAADRLEVLPEARCRHGVRSRGARPVAQADDDADPDVAFGSGRPGVVTPLSGAGSGGLPKGPEPGGGLLGW